MFTTQNIQLFKQADLESKLILRCAGGKFCTEKIPTSQPHPNKCNSVQNKQLAASALSLLAISKIVHLEINILIIYLWWPLIYHIKLVQCTMGVAKVRKEASFRKRKVPFAQGRFWLRKEDIYEKYVNKLHNF